MPTTKVTSGLRHMLCGITACAVFVAFAATASGGNDDASRCNAPGYHYGFDCADLAPTLGDPPPPPVSDPPAPAQERGEPLPESKRGVHGTYGGGLCPVALMA